MFYEVIKNREWLSEFIDKLPEGKFYVSLFARKKYGATEGLKADKAQLKRFITSKDMLVNKLEKLETKLGTYQIDGIPINQDSLCVYITPNARDMHKAGLKTAKEIINMVSDGREIFNPQAIALNQIQTTGIKKYYDIDIDFKKGLGCSYESLLLWIRQNNIINSEAIIGNIIETHGGFHILVELDKVTEKMWYKNFTTIKHPMFDVTMNGDNMIPLCGCVQSTFIPRLC